MKLSDVMSAMDLAVYAEIGLSLFAVAFALVVFDLVRRGKSLESLAHLPLDSSSRPEHPRAEEDWS